METKIERATIRLNEKELMKAAIDHNLETKAQIAEKIGVSVSQLWRATLPVTDPRYCSPGQSFIAGVIAAFGEPFERFFFLEGTVANASAEEV
ncbi:hypothetical protein [Niallia sp. Krafla_26]|uniref:hypothetical protein n=1 Tax=Niallia sp. Krafla_26 TaxID=3064703 RepID=UPI003D17621A